MSILVFSTLAEADFLGGDNSREVVVHAVGADVLDAVGDLLPGEGTFGYINVMVTNDGWQQTLDDDSINLVLVENNSTLDKFLRISSLWQGAYHDRTAVVFIRKTALP